MVPFVSSLSHFWITHGDQYLLDLPFLSSPYYLLVTILGLITAVKTIEYTRRVSKSPPKDVRPILLIFYGFCFGVYGVGSLLFFTATEFGQMFFRCHHDESQTQQQQASHLSSGATGSDYVNLKFQTDVIKHLNYIYLIQCVFNFGSFLIASFSGGASRKTKTTNGYPDSVTLRFSVSPSDDAVELIHQSLWTVLITTYLVLNPIGVSLGVTMLDMLNRLVYHGLGVLMVTEPSGPNAITSIKFKARTQEAVRCICFFFISVHGYYIYSLASLDSCKPPGYPHEHHAYYGPIILVVSFYAAVVSAVAMIRIFSPENQEKKGSQTNYRITRLSKIPVGN